MFQDALARNGGVAVHAGLGMAQVNDSGAAQDDARALAQVRQAESDPVAVGLLGLIHDDGFGVPADDALGSNHLKRTAAMGGARAKANYGVKLLNGSPATAVDLPLSRRNFEAAMAANQGVGTYNCALLLRDGRQQQARLAGPEEGRRQSNRVRQTGGSRWRCRGAGLQHRHRPEPEPPRRSPRQQRPGTAERQRPRGLMPRA